ncbi:MAG: NAD-dependent epimerase/dehydratase family protein [Actinomycetota bacterium]
MPEFDVVTGAFGYTGKYIARRLLDGGRRVRTLTNRPDRGGVFGGAIEAFPLDFDQPDALSESLAGADTLYNTYWVRFPRGSTTYERAVENSKVLFQAAADAAVRRIVHVSITNPIQGSPLPYFHGKAAVEKALVGMGVSAAIVRPTVVFGREDVLINNIAWLLRRSPFFAVPEPGSYRVQPVHVDDVARLCVEVAPREDIVVVEAAGPEIYTFEEMVRLIARGVGSRARVVHTSPELALLLARLVGFMVRDVVLTADELEGLMASLVVAQGQATGETRFSEWLREHGARLGRRYASELGRHFRNGRPHSQAMIDGRAGTA